MSIRDHLRRVRCFLRDIRRIRRSYRRLFGRYPRLLRPRRFTEHIQQQKLRCRSPLYTHITDKLAVRDFVRDRVGPHILNELCDTWDTADAIEPDTLPAAFVLKPTHGSGWVIVCPDRDALDWPAVRAKLSGWLARSYYDTWPRGEYAYHDIPPRILCERLLTSGDGELWDYKIFCFHGEPRLVQVDRGRFTDHRRDLFDLSWERLPFDFKLPPGDPPPPRPEPLDEML
ncbi:MAG: hypothetical protein ACI8S6_004251, partial [Myxococcota bacterium]